MNHLCSSFDELLIEFLTILSVVNSPVAIRAQSNDVIRMVCTSITSPLKVVYLQERFTVRTLERCILTATLTNTVSNTQGVLFDHF